MAAQRHQAVFLQHQGAEPQTLQLIVDHAEDLADTAVAAAAKLGTEPAVRRREGRASPAS